MQLLHKSVSLALLQSTPSHPTTVFGPCEFVTNRTSLGCLDLCPCQVANQMKIDREVGVGSLREGCIKSHHVPRRVPEPYLPHQAKGSRTKDVRKIYTKSTMAPKVDPAIVDALSLDPATSKIAVHGASGFSSTFKLSAKRDGVDVTYFVKTGTGADANVMFRG